MDGKGWEVKLNQGGSGNCADGWFSLSFINKEHHSFTSSMLVGKRKEKKRKNTLQGKFKMPRC